MISSDGGAVLRREAGRRINLLPRLAACFEDRRQHSRVAAAEGRGSHLPRNL